MDNFELKEDNHRLKYRNDKLKANYRKLQIKLSEQEKVVASLTEEIERPIEEILGMWMDVCVECHAIEKIGVHKVMYRLKDKYKIEPKLTPPILKTLRK